jgi:phosphatidate phosphatase
LACTVILYLFVVGILHVEKIFKSILQYSMQITLTEFLSHRRSRATGSFLSRPTPVMFIHMYRSFVDFLFGCVASQLVTDVGKYSIGRLRPNFIAVCNPNVTLTHCECKNKWKYFLYTIYKSSIYYMIFTPFTLQYMEMLISVRNLDGELWEFDNNPTNILMIIAENYVCQSSPDDSNLSRVSFPSGHSSFSAYTMFYLVIFIQMRWIITSKRSYLRLIKCGIQISLILIAYYTALSRVMDNKVRKWIVVIYVVK